MADINQAQVTTSMEFELPSALIVEDDEDVAQITQAMLSALGFRSRVVPTAEQALVELVYRTPDVLLLDIFLPKMTGEDLLRVLPALEYVAKVPVIAMSAVYEPGSRLVTSVRSLGVAEFLSKPFNLADLRAALRTAGVLDAGQG